MEQWFFVNQDNVRVFAKGNADAQKQGWLHQGDRVKVVETYKGWCRLDIKLPDQDVAHYPECWIPAPYLSTDIVAPAPTKVTDVEAAVALRKLIRYVKESL